MAPLPLAARLGRYECVELLLKYGADIQSKGDNGESPLHKACMRPGNLKILKLLLTHHANVNALNDGRWTPLMLSVETDPETVGFLIANGADASLKCNMGNTAFSYANYLKDSPRKRAIMRLLSQAMKRKADDRHNEVSLKK